MGQTLNWQGREIWFSLSNNTLKYKAQPQDVLVFQIKSANKINKFSFFFSVCPLTFEIPSNNKTEIPFCRLGFGMVADTGNFLFLSTRTFFCIISKSVPIADGY